MYKSATFLYSLLVILMPAYAFLQEKLSLTSPRLSHLMVMTGPEAPVLEADFRMEGSVLRYTTDGSIPQNSSPVMGRTLPMRIPCTMKVAAFHPDFAPSTPAEVVVFLKGKPIKSFAISEPDKAYTGNDSLLVDQTFGTTNFRRDYLGFNRDTTTITIQTEPWQDCQAIHLTGLTNTGAWIFPPEKIIVKDAVGTIISSIDVKCPDSDSPVKKWHQKISIPKKKYQKVTVHIPPGILPVWHQGKGSPAWLFLDEVWIY